MGKLLKRVRLLCDFNQQQMADVLGYTRKDIICGIENGHRKMSGVAMQCLNYFIRINFPYGLPEKRTTERIDILDKCVYCFRDTSFGSGRYVDRIPASTDDLEGYSCSDCQYPASKK